jgi:hypothetical protein
VEAGSINTAWDFAAPREEHLRSNEQGNTFDCTTINPLYSLIECEALVRIASQLK